MTNGENYGPLVAGELTSLACLFDVTDALLQAFSTNCKKARKGSKNFFFLDSNGLSECVRTSAAAARSRGTTLKNFLAVTTPLRSVLLLGLKETALYCEDSPSRFRIYCVCTQSAALRTDSSRISTWGNRRDAWRR
jgi:hypothetical protein